MRWLGLLDVVVHGPRRPPMPERVHLRAAGWEPNDLRAQRASLWEMLSALPTAVRVIAGIAWRVSRPVSAAAVAMAVLSGVASATGLLTTNRMLVSLFAAGPTPHRVVAALGVLTLVAVLLGLKALLISGVAACGARLGPGVRRHAEQRLVRAACMVRLSALDDAEYHDELTKACERSLPMFDLAVGQCVGMLTAAIGLAAAVITVAILNPLLAVVVLLAGIPAAYTAVRSARVRHRSVRDIVAFDRRVKMITTLLIERDAAAELRAFAAQPTLLAEHDDISGLRERFDVYSGLVQQYYLLVGRAATGVATVAVYALLAWLLYRGTVPLAVAATAVLALQSAHLASGQVAQCVNQLHEQGLFIADYERVLASCARRALPAAGLPAPVTPRVIELDRVRFAYPGSARPAVDDISAVVRAGQVVALVGENGSGKTTLAKLLAGLYQPDSGDIRWDGVPLTDFRPETIAARVAVIMQEPTRWPLTARGATTLGTAPEAVDERALREAAVATGAQEVVAGLPHGWDTLLSKQFAQGSDLSGGQWQRLAGARALYRDAAILIADEPTANLDAKAEARFYDTLRRICGGRTVFLVTHRLGSTRMADQILVLDRGRLIEAGDHAELMALGGRYAQLYTLQADCYAEQPGIHWASGNGSHAPGGCRCAACSA
jgi:ABC-type multidrug transport system fused ATPase/permease subunit